MRECVLLPNLTFAQRLLQFSQGAPAFSNPPLMKELIADISRARKISGQRGIFLPPKNSVWCSTFHQCILGPTHMLPLLRGHFWEDFPQRFTGSAGSSLVIVCKDRSAKLSQNLKSHFRHYSLGIHRSVLPGTEEALKVKTDMPSL